MFGLFKKKNEEALPTTPEPVVVKSADERGEIVAAIAAALSLYKTETHDYENMVLTMQKVMRPYSPWSSKIYGLRQYPIKMRTFDYEKIQIKNR
ncbi:MAG: OadG family protein [Bacteroidota bacterium]|nr:OadG family protein [Bacteroidota bacterium]